MAKYWRIEDENGRCIIDARDLAFTTRPKAGLLSKIEQEFLMGGGPDSDVSTVDDVRVYRLDRAVAIKIEGGVPLLLERGLAVLSFSASMCQSGQMTCPGTIAMLDVIVLCVACLYGFVTGPGNANAKTRLSEMKQRIQQEPATLAGLAPGTRDAVLSLYGITAALVKERFEAVESSALQAARTRAHAKEVRKASEAQNKITSKVVHSNKNKLRVIKGALDKAQSQQETERARGDEVESRLGDITGTINSLQAGFRGLTMMSPGGASSSSEVGTPVPEPASAQDADVPKAAAPARTPLGEKENTAGA